VFTLKATGPGGNTTQAITVNSFDYGPEFVGHWVGTWGDAATRYGTVHVDGTADLTITEVKQYGPNDGLGAFIGWSSMGFSLSFSDPYASSVSCTDIPAVLAVPTVNPYSSPVPGEIGIGELFFRGDWTCIAHNFSGCGGADLVVNLYAGGSIGRLYADGLRIYWEAQQACSNGGPTTSGFYVIGPLVKQ
jgi:hypothetical protein